MNKDVIYIEPEDDITDIITKIEKSKEKIVALVPPKKAGVFRSIVNIKLIAKSGAAAEKKVVLVTVDPSISKLAAATKLPVAKDLQTAPVIPSVEPEEEDNNTTIDEVSEPGEEDAGETENIDTDDGKPLKVRHEVMPANEEEEEDKDSKEKVEEDKEEEEEEEDEDRSKSDKKGQKGKGKKKSSSNKFLAWLKFHKKLSIIGGVAAVALIIFLVWAFVFAPAVDIEVAIKTESKNFSEAISFTDQLTEEDAKKGKFYLEEKKIEENQEVEFEATGQKNVGEKATGEVVLSYYFPISGNGGNIPVNAGTVFTVNGLSYVSNENAVLIWDGDLDAIKDDCQNYGKSTLKEWGCQVDRTVKVTATNSGANYNIAATTSGWSTTANVLVRSDSAMSGGTDDVKTVVQQSDVMKAQNELSTAKEEENKDKLYKTIGDEYMIIESTFEQKTSSATASPAVDEEVKEGTKPKLTATTTTKVYVINKDKLKEFVKEGANLEDGQRVYEVKDLYIENFTNNGANSTAKLKAQYYIGPKITESEVVDKIRGKGLGDAQREIRDIYGVSNVTMNPSYPWVMAVPVDSNKVTVRFEIKDQNGEELKEQSKEDSNKDGENTENTENSKKTEDNKKNEQN